MFFFKIYVIDCLENKEMYEWFIKVFNVIEEKGYYKNKGWIEGVMYDEKIGKLSMCYYSINRFFIYFFYYGVCDWWVVIYDLDYFVCVDVMLDGIFCIKEVRRKIIGNLNYCIEFIEKV